MAGRLDSTVGYAAAVDLLGSHPRATLAVVDDAGHALPHEQPGLLRALLVEWLVRRRASELTRDEPAADASRIASMHSEHTVNI